MKRAVCKLNKLILIILAVTLVSCIEIAKGSRYVDKYNTAPHKSELIRTGNISAGFTKNEVAGALGSPSRTERVDTAGYKDESWYYSMGRYRRVDFLRGEVVGWN